MVTGFSSGIGMGMPEKMYTWFATVCCKIFEALDDISGIICFAGQPQFRFEWMMHLGKNKINGGVSTRNIEDVFPFDSHLLLFRESENIENNPELPGFSCPVSDFFRLHGDPPAESP